MSDLRDYHCWNIAAVRFSSSPKDVPVEKTEQFLQQVAKAIALEATILGSPEALSVSIPPDQMEHAVKHWVTSHPEARLSEVAIAEGIRRELTVQAVLDGVAAKAKPPTLGEIKAFYADNTQKFSRPERRTIRHILITVNDDFKENTEGAALTRVEGLVAKLKSGADFSQLAGENSECPTAMHGGEVGTVPKGVLYSEVEDVAFGLDVGEWGGPVRTELGWHLVLCDAVCQAEAPNYEAALPTITEHLIQQSQRAVQVAWLKALKAPEIASPSCVSS